MKQNPNSTFEIYIYPNGETDQKGTWQRYASALTKASALEQAEKLYRSYKFRKVQVEQKDLDPQNNITTTKTLKVFQTRQYKASLMTMIFASTFMIVWAFLCLFFC